jgi:hypothetical protein
MSRKQHPVRKSLAKARRPRAVPLRVEPLEERVVPDVRSITGFGNNLANPTWGMAGADLIRLAPSAYADGVNAPAGAGRPNARALSNALSDQTDPNNPSQDLDILNAQSLTDYIYVFGQFLDHDLDLTKDNSGQPFDIPPGSPTDPMGPEPFTRSGYDQATGVVVADLSGAYNRVGIVTDGSTFSSTGGLDRDGNALSANLLGSGVTINGTFFDFGNPGVNDVVSARGQSISLPAVTGSRLTFLATGVNGNQPNQIFAVRYTDGSFQFFARSISDWFTPQNYAGESTAVTMPYRDVFNGTTDNRTFQVYSYSVGLNTGKQVQSLFLPFDPNVEVLAVNVTSTTPRQQIQSDTSFIDASQVYGSDPVRADALRTHSGGRLKDSSQNGAEFLPFNSTDPTNGVGTPVDMANDAQLVPDSSLYAAGDRRANETTQLISMQTLFLREHNRLADQFAAANPTWTDEQIYQAARRVVGAEMEIITYNEWVPALLGPNALPAYTGYKPNVNPGIANEFSTAMFRFAHSQLDNTVDRLNNDGTDVFTTESLGLDQSFFDPNLIHFPQGTLDPVSGLHSTGISPILKGSASGIAQNVDLLAVRSVRNFLFGPEGAGGTDLIARDIQRGRDHGLTDYNSMRAAYGLPRVTSFAQITSNMALQAELQQLYGNVNNIDAFVGALAEDHVPGAAVGPLTKAVLVNQFTRTRDGDSFFYLNQFSGSELSNLLANTSLAKIIERNTAVSNLQADVFHFRVSISGTVFDDDNKNGAFDSFEHGMSGVKVLLKDSSGAVIATDTTDVNGFYSFNQFDIKGTGNFTVTVMPPAGLPPTTPTSVNVLISRGDINATVNFGIDPPSGGAPALAGGSSSGGAAAPGGALPPGGLPGPGGDLGTGSGGGASTGGGSSSGGSSAPSDARPPSGSSTGGSVITLSAPSSGALPTPANTVTVSVPDAGSSLVTGPVFVQPPGGGDLALTGGDAGTSTPSDPLAPPVNPLDGAGVTVL